MRLGGELDRPRADGPLPQTKVKAKLRDIETPAAAPHLTPEHHLAELTDAPA